MLQLDRFTEAPVPIKIIITIVWAGVFFAGLWILWWRTPATAKTPAPEVTSQMSDSSSKVVAGTVGQVQQGGAGSTFITHVAVNEPDSDRQTQDLYFRAISLAREILQFSADRQKSEPPYGPPSDRLNYERQISYSRTTVATYTERYSWRVTGILEELRREGLIDRSLESSNAHPTNPLGVESIGHDLTKISEQYRIAQAAK
ncbi:hypothetical protein [Opitutus terrae]|nr:hypothetical protein [Opitutus terrae]